MEWVLRSTQLHSTFGSLGFTHGDGYHINENCNAALETILLNILIEDKYLRTYRRSISFGQNIEKDLIPLLIHAKDDKTIELLIRILVNLTIPVECLLSVDVIARTDFGRHTIFEITNLLTSTKSAFTDHRATKVIVKFLKKNVEVETQLTPDQCSNICNSLLLLRNILHIPELATQNATNAALHTVQNQILWNIFSQSVDKILIKLMTIPEAYHWGVTMVQLIALLYKDQHVVTLQKLINIWLEASLSESSDDNESNTSPPVRGSEDSSPVLTWDPTTDSSDTEPTFEDYGWSDNTSNSQQQEQSDKEKCDLSDENGNSNLNKESSNEKQQSSKTSDQNQANKNQDMATSESSYCRYKTDKKIGQDKTAMTERSDCEYQTMSKNEQNEQEVISESSDFGYNTNNDNRLNQQKLSESSDYGYASTQFENQEADSTSSNDNEPSKKPVHTKPHNLKQKSKKSRNNVQASLQERKRKKIVQRKMANIINVQGLSHKTPNDDDISNVLKEFTVDFLLKGYNFLVQTLHSQILTNMQLEIDTSHFFWLITYFLKFATQIELDLEHVCSVLSFDIVSFLTAEGANLCEQFELAVKMDGNDLKPCIRRLHLVVTAIREFVQAIEMYKKLSHGRTDEQDALYKLQVTMCETEELRSLMVLLLRYYKPEYHSKQYLQDLIVTNHILLMFMDNVMQSPDYMGGANMTEHIKQFTAPEIMAQYGILLEDYENNGEFVNDCIFTIMHHVAGDLGSIISLFQPRILKIFTSMWKSEFQFCDDWGDLIEYVINTFIKKPQMLQITANFKLDVESFDDCESKPPIALMIEDTQVKKNVESKLEEDKMTASKRDENKEKSVKSTASMSSDDKWTEDEISTLNWHYMQCNSLPDAIRLLKEDGIVKTRASVIKQILRQNRLTKEEMEKLLEADSERNVKSPNNETRDDEIKKLCEQMKQDGNPKVLDWVQKVLLEICYVKLYLEKKSKQCVDEKTENKIIDFEFFKRTDDTPSMSPVAHNALLQNHSVPLVPWNCEQTSNCKDLKFLQLLHKLGFHMPVETGKVYTRIPHFWSADFLYEVAGKIAPIDTSKLKFSVNELSESSVASSPHHVSFSMPPDTTHHVQMLATAEHYFHVRGTQANMVNFTPKPCNSMSSSDIDKSSDAKVENWLDVVQKSQEYKLSLNLDSACETASVASDLTRMYVSDEDEKSDIMVQPPITIAKGDHANMEEGYDTTELDQNSHVGKRARVQF